MNAAASIEIHLDLVGGIAGDMFVAALLDAFPEHLAPVEAAIAAVALLAAVRCELVAHRDAVLTGRRFVVESAGDSLSPAAVGASTGFAEAHPHPHPHGHAHPHESSGALRGEDHGHVAWRRIRTGLEAAPLDVDVRAHALAIFARLAQAEAQVHGIAVDDVGFHEVGAWDSIADIVAAAAVIAAVGAARWTVGAVPLGSGRVRTAHGALPVPAPATALLLRGFATIDDGVGGERVTPTGAAILAHLCGDASPSPRGPRTLRGQGFGFGTRVLPGLSNCVRVLAFERDPDGSQSARDAVAVVEFEVDDQSGEDLAIGLDRLRAQAGVLDVVQVPMFGKKGRVTMHVRALADPALLDDAIRVCFDETTTIGLRHRLVDRVVLKRATRTIDVDGRSLRIKQVERPHGVTAKAEADDVAAQPLHATRVSLRQRAEQMTLDEQADAGDRDRAQPCTRDR